MKYFPLLLLIIISPGALTQDLIWPSSPAEVSTGSNATYLVQNILVDQESPTSGYLLGAFYTNDSGTLSCGGFLSWQGIASSIAVWGDDTTTDEKDGFQAGEEIIWKSYDELNEVTYNATPDFVEGPSGLGSSIFQINGINIISQFIITLPIFGCTDPSGCNYNESAEIEDDSCYNNDLGCGCDTPAAQVGYNCDGSCIDLDNDNVCDLDELLGCTDMSACNFNEDATENDNTCYNNDLGCGCDNPVAPEGYNCNGSCIDINQNDLCDFDEIYGCIVPEALNFNAQANVSDGTCEFEILGCTDATSFNFNPDANLDDGSCAIEVIGCTNVTAINFNEVANSDDGSCIETIYGCMDFEASNFNELANIDNGSCSFPGCTDDSFFNFDPTANSNDDSCIPFLFGCLEPQSFNYNPQANSSDDSCTEFINGCTDPDSFNYNVQANTDDGSCTETVIGCIEVNACNYDSLANISGSCSYSICDSYDCLGICFEDLDEDDVCDCEEIFGCTDSIADNYNSESTEDDGSCLVLGCTIPIAINYDPLSNSDDGMCEIFGCTDPSFLNYIGFFPDPETGQQIAIDDQSCSNETVDVFGCTNQQYLEYDSTATQENGSCSQIVVFGCTNISSFNYNSNTNTDDNSCYAVLSGCMNLLADNYILPTGDTSIDINTSDSSQCIFYGCTNDLFPNYNSLATDDDGSCNMSSNNIFGCTDSLYVEFSEQANQDDMTCETIAVFGCMNPVSFNYIPEANLDHDSCLPYVYGCLQEDAFNFDSSVNTSDESCYPVIEGCMNTTADNYNNPSGNIMEDINTPNFSSCIFLGCTNPTYLEFDSSANADLDPSLCITEKIYGCTDSSYVEYWNFNQLNTGYYTITSPLNTEVNTPDGSCSVSIVEGCVYDIYVEYNSAANIVEESNCLTIIVDGCIDSDAFNFNPLAHEDDGTCIDTVLGCIEPNAFNFNMLANTDDGSCEANLEGCTDSTSFNYNPLANINDNSCVGEILGCTDTGFVEYDTQANTDSDPSSCITPSLYGCTVELASNFDPSANVNDGSCILNIEGCTDDNYFEFNDLANIDDGSCQVLIIEGCTDDDYIEYYEPANIDDGSCEVIAIEGCTDASFLEFNLIANVDDGSCFIFIIEGCMNSDYLEYNSQANTDDLSCNTLVYNGCIDPEAGNYDPFANLNDDSCEYTGCTDSLAFNYNPMANIEDASCIPFISGCTNPDYFEFDPQANLNDGSCLNVIIEGCTDNTAFNFSSLANFDNGTCIPIIDGCIDSEFLEFDPLANTDDQSCSIPVEEGCTDVNAFNFNTLANTDDNSCIYDLLISNAINLGTSSYQFEIIVFSFENYSVLWDFGDGFYSNDENPFHVYALNGTYNVSVSISNGVMAIVDNFVLVIDVPGLDLDEITDPIVKEEYYDLFGRSLLSHLNGSIHIRIQYFESGHISREKIIKQ